MQATIFQRFTLPQVSDPQQPNVIASATELPIRVVVKNIGGATVFLAFAASDLQNSDGSVGTAVWVMGPAETDTHVLAPRQKMFAASSGPAGEVTVAISEALPLI